VTEPPAAGDAEVVSWYCVWKMAVYVVAAVTLIECVAAPPSLHKANTYCVPADPG
jgi:hypothetical protein